MRTVLMCVGHDNRLNFTILLTKYGNLRGNIILSRGVSAASSTRSAVTSNQSTELNKWWNEVEECFDSDHDSETPSMTPYQQTVLSILRHESIISLHREIISNVQMDPEYSAALQNCITSARSIINSLYTFLQEKRLHRTSSLPYPLPWPSFTWAIWMSAFIVLHAASENQLNDAAVNRSMLSIVTNLDITDELIDFSTAVSQYSST